MKKALTSALIALATCATPVAAQTKLDFILNWVPGGDHAPYYYANKMGWYAKEGLQVNLEPGKGSAPAVQKVGAGANPIGLADMGNVLVGRGKGAEMVGVFNVYANSPQGVYWLKSSGIKGIKDLAGKKIGNPAGDGARSVWPALAKNNGLDPKSVIWVNIDANSKLAALKSKAVDATTSFYNLHHVFQRELGDDMGFLAWRDAGLNTYGNSVVVNTAFLAKNKPAIDKFVKVTQRAFAACVADPKSVIWVNIDANSKLAALKSKAVDATTSFYNLHHVFQRELGDDMGFLAWRDAGLNTYGNSVVVNTAFLAKNKPAIDKFVKVTQRAFAACVADPKPCVQALIDANGALKYDNEMTNWQLVEVLMSDKFSKTVALGIHDDARMAADYALYKDYVGLDKEFDVKTTYTNEFLDRSIKMTK